LTTQQGNSTEKGLFYFSHSGAILKFLGFLGLYKDHEHLTASNYVTYKSHRLYRTSVIDPFASNIAFVIFKDLRVSLYHNEELIQIPGCSELKCKFMELKSLFKERLSNCIFDQLCKTDSSIELDETHTADDRF
jgi:multiple inositol-polyphosphate phosphatase/2,3-bisphosphoglycerate 3-phosphatase